MTVNVCGNFISNFVRNICLHAYFQIFDDNGDGTMGYQIYNVQEDPSNKNVLTYVKVSTVDSRYLEFQGTF